MNKTDLIMKEMKTIFGCDQKRINHAKAVLRYAQEILERETVENREVVEAATCLHDIGIHEAEKKYKSTAGHFQEKEGPPIARKILEKLDFPEKFIAEVCEIIAHHHMPGVVKTRNFQVLYEADWLVNLEDDFQNISKKRKKLLIEKNFLTKTGKALAVTRYLTKG